MNRRACAVAIPAGVLLSTTAGGHGGGEHPATLAPPEVWTQWSFDAAVVVPLLVSAGVYAFGLYRMWRRAGPGRGIPYWRAAAFAAGLAVLAGALVSPLDAAGAALFSLHMVQHLLLILVAPPLLVLGWPDLALLWALPQRWRSAGAGVEGHLRSVTGHARSPRGPLLIVLLATATLWAWHVPALYDLAVRNEAVHWSEHATFLITALLFWVSVLRLRPRDHAANGLRILYVFGMALQGSILGALLTFAARPLYAAHARIDPAWGLEPLADQQIAGLIMWVPPAVLYVGVTAYLFSHWLTAVAARNQASGRRP